MPSLSAAASCAWYHSDAVYTSNVSAAQLHRTTNSQMHTRHTFIEIKSRPANN